MVRDERGLIHSAAILAVILLTTDRALCQNGPLRFGLKAGPAFVESSVTAALQDAGAKLETAACREVFSDFRDARGETLTAKLERLGQTPRSYLDLVMLYEGEGLTRCSNREILASTTPGSRAVYVCGRQFAQRQRRAPGLAADILIHEELHSLGLEENPPASTEITARVVARCGV